MSTCSDLDPLNQTIIQEIITTPSITDIELAKKLNVSRQTINKRRNSEIVKNQIKLKLEINTDQINSSLTKAWAKLTALLDDPDTKVQLAAANSILKVTADRLTLDARNLNDYEFEFKVTPYIPPKDQSQTS